MILFIAVVFHNVHNVKHDINFKNGHTTKDHFIFLWDHG